MPRHSPRQRIATWSCGLGIILLLLGFRAYRYLPMTEEEIALEKSQQFMISMMREAVHQSDKASIPVTQKLLEELESSSIRNRKTAPFYWHGVISMTLGIFLLSGGCWLWFRNSRKGRWIHDNEDA